MSKSLSSKSGRSIGPLSTNVRNTPMPTKAVTISELPSTTGNSVAKDHVVVIESPQGTRSISLLELKKHLLEEFIGTIQAFGSDKIPTNYLICEGQQVSIVEYPKLYEKIGTTFGDNSANPTAFTLPDLRSQFLRGATDTVPVGTMQQDTVQNIQGSFNGMFVGDGTPGVGIPWACEGAFYTGESVRSGNLSVDNTRDSWPITHFDASRVVRTSEETRPKNIRVVFAIRAK